MGEMWSSPMLVKPTTAKSTPYVRSYLRAWLDASITSSRAPTLTALAMCASSSKASGVVSLEGPQVTPSSSVTLEKMGVAWAPRACARASSTLLR